MRGGEIGHTQSTVLDAPVTQRAMHVIGRGWGAARIAGRGSDTRIVAGRNLDAACILGRGYGRSHRCRAGFGRSEGAERSEVARKRPQCPKLVRERGHYPKALTQTHAQARAWQNIPVRAILFHSPYEAPRYVGARRAAIAHAVMRSDSAEGGPWHTTPYKKIACA